MHTSSWAKAAMVTDACSLTPPCWSVTDTWVWPTVRALTCRVVHDPSTASNFPPATKQDEGKYDCILIKFQILPFNYPQARLVSLKLSQSQLSCSFVCRFLFLAIHLILFLHPTDHWSLSFSAVYVSGIALPLLQMK